MQEKLHAWLVENGFPDLTGLTAMQAGLGSTGLWSFTPEPEADPLIARVYGLDSDDVAAREALAMTTAAGVGVPVPRIVAQGTVERRPVTVMTFLPGVQARDALLGDVARAEELGRAMGETLGRLHTAAAPDAFAWRERAWLEVGGPALDPIRPQLANLPMPDRLLHLDYHPLNVLVENGQVTGVIDWENARAGSPYLDVARTRAILKAILISVPLPPGGDDMIDRFERAFMAGHAAVIGPDPHPELSLAWGLAMTVADLEAQARKPGSPVSPELIAGLITARDAAIAAVRDAGMAPHSDDRPGQG